MDKSDPALWERVKAAITAADKGGKPGQWSARKAQLATAEYQRQGGGYSGPKRSDNHLSQWTRQAWRTRSGKLSLETGERYLPTAAHAALTPEEERRTSARKRRDLRAGRQFSAQPADIAGKTAAYRKPKTGRQKTMDDGIPDDIGPAFRQLVNMSAATLRRWLETEESQAAGIIRDGETEAVGHQSGRRILALLEHDGAEPREAAFQHKVVGFIRRHLAQRPDGDVSGTRWRHSLMNWGHDPMLDESEGATAMTESSSRKPAARKPASPAKRRAAPTAVKRAASATSKRGSTATPKRAAAAKGGRAKPASKRALTGAAASKPARAAAPRKAAASRGTKAAATRSATTKRATPAVKPATAKRTGAAPAKRAAATPKTANGAVSAKRTKVGAAPKRVAAKPTARGTAGRSAAAKGGRSSSSR